MRWTWDELQTLPINIYQVLIEELNREADEYTRDRERQKVSR